MYTKKYREPQNNYVGIYKVSLILFSYILWKITKAKNNTVEAETGAIRQAGRKVRNDQAGRQRS